MKELTMSKVISIRSDECDPRTVVENLPHSEANDLADTLNANMRMVESIAPEISPQPTYVSVPDSVDNKDVFC